MDENPGSLHMNNLWLLIKSQNWLTIVVIIALVALFMAPVYGYRILQPVNSDFGNHNQFALSLVKGERVPDHILAHPFYQLSIAGLIWLTRSRLDASHASILLMVCSQVVGTLIIYFWLGKRNFKGSELLRAVISIGLTIVAPLMALQPLDGKYYFGYIGLVNFHNPTVIYLRPFALLMMIFLVDVVTNHRTNRLLTFLAALVTILATLEKPSFTLTILPVAALCFIYGWYRKQPGVWLSLLWGILLPGGVILAGQYLFTYFSSHEAGGQIIFAPLAVEQAASDYLAVKFLFSIYLIIVLSLTYGKDFFTDRSIRLAGAAFLFGAAQLYLLAESGNRMDDGNFRWGAQITLFILFVCGMRFLWRREILTKKELLAGILGLLPHMLAGVLYWLHCLSSKGYG